MKVIALIPFAVVLLTNVFCAQDNYKCGTEVTYSSKKEYLDFINLIKSNKSISFDSLVPVKFHFISYSDSSETMDSTIAFNTFQNVIPYFLNAGIVLKHCGNIDYIYSDQFANFKQSYDEIICDQKDFLNVLNIYFCPRLYRETTVTGTFSELCGYAPNPNLLTHLKRDRIFIRNSCCEKSTFAHELGHYFSLLHTHETIFGLEYVNGSNCENRGDLLCGTPADPNIYNLVNPNSCQYGGQQLDPLGYYYSPDERNIMSYSHHDCRDRFSTDQIIQMKNFFNYNSKNLHCIIDTDVSLLTNNLDFILFPNPVQSNIGFASNLPNETVFDLSIIDVFGKIILKKEIKNFSYVDINSLSIGTYFFQIKYNQQVVTKKFIKA